MKPLTKRWESEVAAIAKAWLESRGLTVYQEVEADEGRADLIGRGRTDLVAVETKLRLGLGVLVQAHRWRHVATECWAILGYPVPIDARFVVDATVAATGIGIGWANNFGRTVEIVHAAVPNRLVKTGRLLKCLHDEQRDGAAAGTNGGGYSTAFRRTATRLVAYVAANPGVTLADAVGAIEHHYRRKATALSSLGELLLRPDARRPDALGGIRVEGKGRKAQLFPIGEDVF